jgi:hypothetical protein
MAPARVVTLTEIYSRIRSTSLSVISSFVRSLLAPALRDGQSQAKRFQGVFWTRRLGAALAQ